MNHTMHFFLFLIIIGSVLQAGCNQSQSDSTTSTTTVSASLIPALPNQAAEPIHANTIGSFSNSVDQPAWEWTSNRLISNEDVINLTCIQLDLMRNEIYARKGWIFARADLVDYFTQQSWYRPAGDEDKRSKINHAIKSELSPTEQKNIAILHEYEHSKGCLPDEKTTASTVDLSTAEALSPGDPGFFNMDGPANLRIQPDGAIVASINDYFDGCGIYNSDPKPYNRIVCYLSFRSDDLQAIPDHHGIYRTKKAEYPVYNRPGGSQVGTLEQGVAVHINGCADLYCSGYLLAYTHETNIRTTP